MADSKHSPTVWTQADLEAAADQGWVIADCDGSEHAPFQLQKLDEADLLATDEAAWELVVTHARRGDGLALRALEFLRVNAPAEYSSIEKVHGALPSAESR